MLVLPGGKANLAFARFVAEESQAGRPFDVEDLLILNHTWIERRMATSDAARVIQKSETEARARLQRLVESGIIEARGERKGRAYHLSAASYRRLGEKAAYVRQRGFESLQQEQMVLQYVDKHGRITRKEAAELCQISSAQAYRLLHKLLESGKLRAVWRAKRNLVRTAYIKYARVRKFYARVRILCVTTPQNV